MFDHGVYRHEDERDDGDDAGGNEQLAFRSPSIRAACSVVQGNAIRQKRLGERGQHDRQDGQHRQQRNASAAHAVGGRSGCIVDVGIAWFVSVGIVFRHVRSLPL